MYACIYTALEPNWFLQILHDKITEPQKGVKLNKNGGCTLTDDIGIASGISVVNLILEWTLILCMLCKYNIIGARPFIHFVYGHTQKSFMT